MAIGDVYQVRVFQTYQDQELINVFHYIATGGLSATAENLYSGFADQVWDLVRGAQHADCVTRRFTVINSNDNTDQEEATVSSPGTYVPGSMLPAFLAYGLRSQRPYMGQRYSYKRIGGCVNELTPAGIWNTSVLAHMYAISNAFSAVVNHLGLGIYAPVQTENSFQMGEPLIVKYLIEGQWLVNQIPTHQDTRQSFDWVLLED